MDMNDETVRFYMVQADKVKVPHEKIKFGIERIRKQILINQIKYDIKKIEEELNAEKSFIFEEIPYVDNQQSDFSSELQDTILNHFNNQTAISSETVKVNQRISKQIEISSFDLMEMPYVA